MHANTYAGSEAETGEESGSLCNAEGGGSSTFSAGVLPHPPVPVSPQALGTHNSPLRESLHSISSISINDLGKSQAIYCYRLVFSHCSIPVPGEVPPLLWQDLIFTPVTVLPREQPSSGRWLRGIFSILAHSTDLARCGSYNTLPCHSLGVSQRSLNGVYKAETSLSPQEAPQVQTAASGLYETPSHCDTLQHCNLFDVPNLKYWRDCMNSDFSALYSRLLDLKRLLIHHAV